MVRDPFGALGHIKNAGAILMGDYTPPDARRLPGRPQPHAADQRHRPLRLALACGHLYQEVQLYLLNNILVSNVAESLPTSLRNIDIACKDKSKKS